MTTAEYRRQHPEKAALWRANADANAKKKRDAERAAQAERMATYDPPNVRTYGEPWDSRIRAAAVASVPYPESPNKGTRA